MKKLITIDVTGDKPEGLGLLEYKYIPHLHDWVEIEIDKKAFMFEVIKVAHSSVGAGSDIYVKRLKDTVSSILHLCQST